MAYTISTRLAIEGEKEYKDSIKECNRELRLLQSELKKTESEFIGNENSIEALTAKGQVLEKMYEEQAEKVRTLQEAVEQAKSAHDQYGEETEKLAEEIENTKAQMEEMRNSSDDTTEAEKELAEQLEELEGKLEKAQERYDASGRTLDDWTQKLNYAERDLNKLGAEIDDNNQKIGSIKDGTDGASAGMSAMQSASSALGKEAGMLGGAIGGLVSGGIEGLIDAGAQAVGALIDMAKAIDEAKSIIVEATGASGEALQEMVDIARDVNAVTDASGIEEVAGVVGELNTRLGLEGQELERVTTLIEDYSDVTGTDAVGSVRTISNIMKNWNIDIEDTEGLLDKLVLAGQKSGISVDSLGDSLVTNKAILQELGFSLDESIGLISMMEAEGINASQVFTGMRTALTKFADEGKSADEGFSELTERIANATTESEALNIATEYFGKRAGAEMMLAIRSGRFEIDEWAGALENAQGTLEETEKNAQTTSENIEKFFGNLGNSIVGQFENVGEFFGNIFKVPVQELTKSASQAENFANTMGEVNGTMTQYSQVQAGITSVQAELTANTEALKQAVETENSANEEQLEIAQKIAEAKGLSVDQVMEEVENLVAYKDTIGEIVEIEDEDLARLVDLQEQKESAIEQQENLTEAIQIGNEALETYNGIADEILAVSPELAEAYEKEAQAQQEAQQWYDQTNESMQELEGEIQSLTEAYGNAYNNAYENISGQIGLFQTMDGQAKTTVDDMIGALDSQISYMDTYAQNMQRAMELGIDEGLLAKLSDGSEESAQYLQAIVDDGGEHIEELNEKLGKVEEGKETFSGTVAEIQTDFSDKMGEIEDRMGEMVDNLNQKGEAYSSASQTVQGFINGAKDRYHEVYLAYQGMAEQANNAVKDTLDIHSPSRVMRALGDFTAEGFIEGVDQKKSEIYRSFSDMASQTIKGYADMQARAQIDLLSAPSVSEAIDNSNAIDNRVLNVNIEVASASEEDMQEVYQYISRNFGTKVGAR